MVSDRNAYEDICDFTSIETIQDDFSDYYLEEDLNAR